MSHIRLTVAKTLGTLPLHGRHGFGWTVQILFELQLEGLADGADDTLG